VSFGEEEEEGSKWHSDRDRDRVRVRVRVRDGSASVPLFRVFLPNGEPFASSLSLAQTVGS
jgi:hypothetical protein